MHLRRGRWYVFLDERQKIRHCSDSSSDLTCITSIRSAPRDARAVHRGITKRKLSYISVIILE